MGCKNIILRNKKGKQYLIHYLGGASFVVQVFNNTVNIYTTIYNPDISPGKLVFSINICKLFVPSSLKPGDKIPKSIKDICEIGLAGNSLLAQIDEHNSGLKLFRYLYIGHDVVEVFLDEPVENYYSELVTGFASNPYLKVGADMPLAYAVTKNYVYLFHNMKRYSRNSFPSLRDIIPQLNPATDYSSSLKSAMKKTEKRIKKKILVPFSGY